MCKISLIIPIYNTSKTFENTFNSIKNQSIGFENIELIYVDDCSTDNSKKLIEEKTKKYDNVKYYRTKKNSGFPSRPRNIGIKNATSKYLMFLDQDDIFFEDACETLYDLIIKNDADLVSGNYLVNSQTNALLNWDLVNIKENEIAIIDNVDKNKNLLRLNPAIWTKIYKKSFLIDNEIYFVNEILIEDVIFVSECLLKSNNMVFINKPIVNYLLRFQENKSNDEGSLSIAKNKKVLYALINGIKIFNNRLKDYDQDYHWLAVRHLNYWMAQFIESNLSREEKLELLIYSYDLFKDYGKYEKAKPSPQHELIFEKIINEEFIDAIELSEYYCSLNKPPLKNDILKEKKFLIISKNFEKLNQDIINEINKTNLDITFIELDILNQNRIKNRICELFAKNNSENIPKINFYEYFFNKPEFSSNNINNEEIPDENILINQNQIILKENFDECIVLNYYKNNFENNLNSQITPDNMIKQKYFINNSIVYEISFKHNNIIKETFFTSEGIEYLTISNDTTHTYEFKNKVNSTFFKFYSQEDLIKYFFTEIFQKYSNYCIVNFEEEYANIIENVRSKSSISIHYLNNEVNLSNINFLLGNSHSNNEQYIVSPDITILNKIKKEYQHDNIIQIPTNFTSKEDMVIEWLNCLNKIIIKNKLALFDDITKLNNYKKIKNDINNNFNEYEDLSNANLSTLPKEDLIIEIDKLIKIIEKKEKEIIFLKEDIMKDLLNSNKK